MDELALIVSKGTTTTDERISRGKKIHSGVARGWMDCIKDEPLRGFESDLNGRLTFKRQGKGPGQLQPSSLARKAGQSGDTRRDKGHLGGNQRFMPEDKGIGNVTGRTEATAYRRLLKLHCGSWPGRRRCGPRTNKSRRRRDWPARDFG
jgi:hypothetical protein